MKPKSQYFFALAIIIILILGSCSPAPVTNTPIPPTSTITFTLTPTNTPSPPIESPTPEIVEYKVSKEAKDFRQSYIPPEALFDGKNGEVSSFVRYLKSLPSEPYNENNLKFIPLTRWNSPGDEEVIVYKSFGTALYSDPSTRPYRREVFGTTTFEGVNYFISPVRYYVEGLEPKDYPFVIAVFPFLNNDEKGTDLLIKYWLEEMNFPAYLTSENDKSLFLNKDYSPLVKRATFNNPNIQKLIDMFVQGDYTSLDGKVLEVKLQKSIFYK